jgi:HEAT repeat protein
VTGRKTLVTAPRWACLLIVVSVSGKLCATSPPLGDLIRDLTGSNPTRQAQARMLLPRQGLNAAEAVMPFLAHDNPMVAKSAFNILMDIANESCSPGREKDRTRITDLLMTLIDAGRSQEERIVGLRLLERTVPAGYDLEPIALMLDEPPMIRDKAQTALQRIGSPEARACLRAALESASPEFQCALLNSIAELRDEQSLPRVEELTHSPNGDVRAAAVRALAWTGNPVYINLLEDVIAATDGETQPEAMDALLRLLNAMEADRGNRQMVRDRYLRLLETGEGVFKDAALAGLGRVGDESCVTALLAAMETSDIRTRLNAANALRVIRGPGVTRALADAFPSLPQETQRFLIPVLAEKKHPMVMPILERATHSDDPALRLIGLEALGAIGLYSGLETLVEYARAGTDVEKTVARENVVQLAESLHSEGKKREAGRTYLAAYGVTEGTESVQWFLNGIASCPVAEAYDAIMELADDGGRDPVLLQALVAVGEALLTDGERTRARKVFERVRSVGPNAELAPRVAKGLAELGVEVDVAAMLGFVTRWWLVGPFELGDNNEGWDREYIGEPNIDLAGSYPSGDGDVGWVQVHTEDENGRIDLRAAVADRDFCVAYAYTEITLPEGMSAWLFVGVDDSEKVWVNGEKVFELFVARPLSVDQDWVPIALNEGTNRILMKVWQHILEWEFCARITTPDGVPIAVMQPNSDGE